MLRPWSKSMKKLNINCNGHDTIQDTIEIEDALWNELERAIKEGRVPKFYLVDDRDNYIPLN